MNEELNPITEITVEHIRELLGYIYSNNRRTIKLVRGCAHVNGGVPLLYDCKDPTCVSCSNVRENISEEIKEEI